MQTERCIVKVYMKKRLHSKTAKHVLSILRKIIGASLSESKAVLGLAPDTVKSIQSGRLRFSEQAAATVAEKTGVALDWLMQGDGSKPPITAEGKQFTEETFNRHEMQHDKFTLALPDSRKMGNESFRLYLLLCIKLGRVMLAAADAKDGKFAAWKLRDELGRVGRNYPAFESKDVVKGVVRNQTAPEIFDVGLQTMLNTGTKPKQLWATMLDRFNKELCAIETAQAKAAASKPKAKPPRR